ncbi:DUF2752 domain-containing protein [candidate division KSB1 bacterium]|nr:DUF2752 domain-containing protein [candidate division KSB1 bacterium]
MHFRSRKFFELQAGLALLIIGVLGFLIVQFCPALLTFIPPCMFRLLTGIPCPACGATSAGVYLSKLEIGMAFAASPLFTLLYMAMIVVAINSLVGAVWGKNLSLQLSDGERKTVRYIALVAVPLNWLYLVIAVLLR